MRALIGIGKYLAAITLLVTTAIAITPSATAIAAGTRTRYEPPQMDMRLGGVFDDTPLFTGETGFLFYSNDDDNWFRWHISGRSAPKDLGRFLNGIDAVSTDGRYVSTGIEVHRVSDGSSVFPGVFDCDETIGRDLAPSVRLGASYCPDGRIRIYDYGREQARVMQLDGIPDRAVGGDVVLNDDGSFRLILGQPSELFEGATEPGKIWLRFDSAGELVERREPRRASASTAAQYESRSGTNVADDIDVVSGAGIETASGELLPFNFDGIGVPDDVNHGIPSFTYINAVTSNGYGSGCSREEDLTKYWCWEGDLLSGEGRWFAQGDGQDKGVGNISADGRYYQRRTSANELFIQQTVYSLGAGDRTCFDVAGSAGATAVVNVTPVESQGPGFLQVVSSNLKNPPQFSNANYDVGTVDPNVAASNIGSDGRVCVVNQISRTHAIADHLGTINDAAFTPARTNGAPKRTADTRNRANPVGPGKRVCFAVAGNPGDHAMINLTPVGAQGGGFVQLVSSDIADPPSFSNANYGPGTIDPNVAIAPIGADNKVCAVNSDHTNVHIIADHLGTIDKSAFTPARTNGAPKRTADTRNRASAVGPGERVCFAVAGRPGDFAVVNLTPVEARGGGFVQLVSSDLANPPSFSNANFTPGSIDPNVAIAPIGDSNRVCAVNSDHTDVHIIADHLGTIDQGAFTPARTNGAPKRTLDTRPG